MEPGGRNADVEIRSISVRRLLFIQKLKPKLATSSTPHVTISHQYLPTDLCRGRTIFCLDRLHSALRGSKDPPSSPDVHTKARSYSTPRFHPLVDAPHFSAWLPSGSPFPTK